DLGHAHPLVAVVREQPRKAGAERNPEHQHTADRFLRELTDVADVLAEDIESAGHVAVEEERLGERERVILRPRSGLQRQREALAAAEEVRRLKRQLAEEPFELRYPGAERQLIAVLLLELQPHVDLVRLVRRFL